MKTNQLAISSVLLILLSGIILALFVWYFPVWSPRYYLFLGLLPAVFSLFQLASLRSSVDEEVNLLHHLALKAYPFFGAILSLVIICLPIYMQKLMPHFWEITWPALPVLFVTTLIGQRVAHHSQLTLEKQNIIGRMTGEVQQMKVGQDTLIEQIVNGVLIVDQTGKVVLCNKEACKILDIEHEKALGRGIEELISPRTAEYLKLGSDSDPAAVFKKKLLSTREPGIFNAFDTANASGGMLTLDLSISPMIEEGERDPSKFILVFENITERHQLEKMQGDFVNIASHELRTPLTAINGYLSMLLSGQDLGEEDRKLYLSRIYESTRRLSKLVKNILNVSRIDRNKMKVEFKAIDPLKVLSEEMQNLSTVASAKNIKLSIVSMIDPAQRMRGDEDMFREIVINMTDNAIKYSKENTQVEVTVRNIASGSVRIEFKDQGMGIEEKNVTRLFKQFYRVENSMTEEQQGTGLGLYITKKYIDAMEGEIGVTSVFGTGSTFYFDLQQFQEQVAAVSAPAAAPVPAQTTDPAFVPAAPIQVTTAAAASVPLTPAPLPAKDTATGVPAPGGTPSASELDLRAKDPTIPQLTL